MFNWQGCWVAHWAFWEAGQLLWLSKAAAPKAKMLESFLVYIFLLDNIFYVCVQSSFVLPTGLWI
jgi:hypothetical protein